MDGAAGNLKSNVTLGETRGSSAPVLITANAVLPAFIGSFEPVVAVHDIITERWFRKANT